MRFDATQTCMFSCSKARSRRGSMLLGSASSLYATLSEMSVGAMLM